ncbi:MAG TPA: preprotein translocase subunit SecE [Acidobacteriota bacterium]|nr:preprotein translocase subunit SecE [bacterium]HNX19907.1 preprotein translocase subunit SecE [Acidobacteriota bacterium]
MKFFRKIRSFFDDVVKELKRTSWPSRNEVQGTTVVVVVTVVIVSVYLYGVDLLLGTAQKYLLFRGVAGN